MQIRTRTQAISFTAAYVGTAVGISLLLILALTNSAELPLGKHPMVVMGITAILALVTTPAAWWSARQQFRHTLTQQQLRAKHDLDPLTGLLNRPAFVQQSTDLVEQVPQSKPYTLLLLDLDFFPEFCETHGNLEADRVLQHFAAHLAARVRDSDFFCRLDRESFALLLVGANVKQTKRLADRIVSAVAQRPFSSQQSILEFTASCGYADSTNAELFDALHANAASALLQAKRQGHNRAVAFNSPTEPTAPATTSSKEQITS